MLTTYIDKKVLITTVDWFYTGDGKNYKAVWGTLKGVYKVDELLGFAPNRPNVNWVFEIGNMIIYGCQVKFIVLRDEKPNLDGVDSWTSSAEHGLKEYHTPNMIYVAED